MTEFLIFVFGAVWGSFLNMLIYRLPLGISLVNPKRSKCTTCNHIITWYENIPVISYFFILKGKCSGCGEKISLVYPIVEILTGFVTLLIYLKTGISFESIFILILFYILITLSFIDLKFKAVPDYLLIAALIFAYIAMSNDILEALKNSFLFAGGVALLELVVTFYIQNIKSRIVKDESLKEQRSMGEGDIPIFAVMGAILGVKLGLVAVFLSAVLAIVPAVFNMVLKKDIETPFIPFLSLGLFFTFIFDNYISPFLG